MMGIQINRGLYSSEILDCGCEIKRYGLGGKTILVASTRCTNEIKCVSKITHECGKCGLVTSKQGLKKHQWEHTS